ncbi:MAG: hypothetical protein MJ052_06010 [Sphaerochaetaceae bacterium]|nr:hypothetical protein [Sphaerochaetaceae bacterium]
MEFTKDLKKKSDERKIIENLFMKASSSSMYIPDFTGFPAVRRFSHSGICEIEKILTSETSFQLPLCADVDGDGHEEYIVPSKNSVCFLSPRGASVTRFNITGSLQDIAFHNGEGIFSDSFVKMSEHKPVTLSSKYFEISCLDKKRHDFFAKSPQFELNRIPVILLKHFKFRTNTVICEIEIENIGHVEIKDYTYESRLNFAFPKDMKFICSETERTVNDEFTSDCQTVQTVSQNTGLSLGIILNEIMNMSVKPVIHSVKGLESFYDIYQYSQMKIQKQLTIKPGESVHIAIGLRIDKRKETK